MNIASYLLPWSRWSIALGFALGGFFDGILLHQILQWHHLLSLVPGLEDMRLQVLWDGYFHALMYLLAAIGLWGLWRARLQVGTAGGRRLCGLLLVGFGFWHVADAVVSHWLLGIHRIKLDSPNPLAWDLAWFMAFGVTPIAAGWILAGGTGSGSRTVSPTAALLIIASMTIGAGLWSMRPSPDEPFTTIVFRPGIEPPQVYSALATLDARLVWAAPSMNVIAVDMPPAQRWRPFAMGALLVSGAGVPAGCFAWSRV